MQISERDREVAWATMWGEARGESDAGMRAVAWVILHRAANPRWWGRGVEGVCLQPRQYSCWNDDDPQSVKLHRMFDAAGAMRPDALATPVMQRIRRAWFSAESGKLGDPTGGATHYLTRAAYAQHQTRSKAWSRDREPHVVIGAHLFFRPADIGEAPIRPYAPRRAAPPAASPSAAPPPAAPPVAAPRPPAHPGLIAMLIAFARRLLGIPA